MPLSQENCNGIYSFIVEPQKERWPMDAGEITLENGVISGNGSIWKYSGAYSIQGEASFAATLHLTTKRRRLFKRNPSKQLKLEGLYGGVNDFVGTIHEVGKPFGEFRLKFDRPIQ